MGKGEAEVSRKSEREAAARAAEILKAAHGRGDDVGGDYGSGKLTRAQKKSQEKHIPFTPGPKTKLQKFLRDAIG